MLAVGAALLAQSIDQAITNADTDTKRPEKTFITYTLTNPAGQIYVGRASGYGDPVTLMNKRYSGHHMRARGFANPQFDQLMTGPGARDVIKGREQQLIDFHSGVGSPNVGNPIRAVAKLNPYGLTYHGAASRAFGEIHEYTGSYWKRR